MPTPSKSARPHLVALLLALLVTACLLGGVQRIASRLETHYLRAAAPLSLPIKDQGTCLASRLAQQPDVLPLYGSSELVKNVREKASVRFRCYPTEFAVSPIGKAGTTSLMIAQKIAAIGPSLSGRKVAISISPGWFYSAQLDPRHYAGNFSSLQAAEIAFASPLSHDLRRELALRMLDFPGPLEKEPVVTFALEALARDSWTDRIDYALCRPLGLIEVRLMRLQDHAHAAAYLWEHHNELRLHPPQQIAIDWDREELKWANRSTASPVGAVELRRWRERWNGDDSFLKTLGDAAEWRDLELLLRTLNHIGAKPLLVSMPMDGTFLDEIGISANAREVYYKRLDALAARYAAPVVDFEDHDRDPRFLVDRHDHPTVGGWIYMDKTLDDFFHDRLHVPPRRRG